MSALPFTFGTSFVGSAGTGAATVPTDPPTIPGAALVPAVVIDWDGEGFLPGDPTGATATAVAGSSDTYFLATTADAGDVAVGDRCYVVDSAGAYRWLRLFTVAGKTVAGANTQIHVSPRFPWAPGAGDVLRVATANRKDVTRDVLAQRGMSVSIGRDDARALSPPAASSGQFTLKNVDRVYSPLNAGSPLYGDLGPGRPVTWEMYHDGTSYTLFTGRLDDFQVSAAREDRSVAVTVLDGLARLRGTKISTGLYQSIFTGEAIDVVLDEAGWNADERDIDRGATIARHWWEDDVDAFTALERLLASEGPPSLMYVSGSGVFTFRGRHHRLVRSRSVNSQVTFGDDADEPRMSGLVLDLGWRNVVNDVSFAVTNRGQRGELSAVWEADGPIVVRDGETVEVTARASDPFTDAVTPVEGTDYTEITGEVSISLSRASGQSTVIAVSAVGGPAVINDLQVRAYSVPVTHETKVSGQDPDSIELHQQSTWPDEAPWAGVWDARAIKNLILGRQAQPRPSVRLRLVHKDLSSRLREQLSRSLSDCVHITEAETGLDGDFHIERIEHSYDGDVLSTVFGCEQVPTQAGGTSVTRAFVIGSSVLGGEALGSRLIDVPSLVMVLGSGAVGGKVLAT